MLLCTQISLTSGSPDLASPVQGLHHVPGTEVESMCLQYLLCAAAECNSSVTWSVLGAFLFRLSSLCWACGVSLWDCDGQHRCRCISAEGECRGLMRLYLYLVSVLLPHQYTGNAFLSLQVYKKLTVSTLEKLI